MYYLLKNGKYVIILLYVDDLLVTGDDQYQINQVEKEVNKTFEMIDLGNIKLY
jgi:hypothetical protein